MYVLLTASSRLVLVVGVGCFVLVESVLASILSEGSIFASVFFFFFL